MNPKEYDRRETHKKPKRPPRQKRNPIEAAISSWYEKHAAHLHNVDDLIAQAPKRWTAYGPLVLLPAGSFTSPAWRQALGKLSNSTRSVESLDNLNNKETSEENENPSGPALLWKTILANISSASPTKLTHLAINEGIPLRSKESNEGTRAPERENILRSPSGLRILHGDFGPPTTPAPSPTQADFARAFWVATKQNGITQTWAPRWTMFSRGNVKEKARLLAFHDASDRSTSSSSHHRALFRPHQGAAAVDLYAGIGYFAFCYAALGFRVLCWELNPWSVEGLRRGAAANGWGVRVIVPPAQGNEYEDGGEERMLRDVIVGDETIVVFLEDNTRAAGRIRKLDEFTRAWGEQRIEGERDRDGDGRLVRGVRMRDIVHVNLGLLPSSQGSWGTAWEIASHAPRAWFHIHENVGVSDIDGKKGEIQEWFAERAARGGEDSGQTQLCVEHVEKVKTFAPGVWHCVFDLYVGRGMDIVDNIT
ncbi:S-adenosyl-L-methionine-dependent methyltransferase [Nemania diffusa]|nr:S-adenosyl-L-methionine-dependent methyltransferase [Nemania diffusa]